MLLSKKQFRLFAIGYWLLATGNFASAQDESSPILQQKEKQSEIKKTKSCTGTYYSYEKNGIVSKEGHKSCVESYNKLGDLTRSVLYSPDEKISETTQCHYDSTGKLMEEEKIIPNLPTQKHTYHYKNGMLNYGEVWMDTEIVHTCYYVYEHKRLAEIITKHHILLEKGIPVQEAIVYKYDDKGNKFEEKDYEIELSSEKTGNDNDDEKPKYKVIKLISKTDFVYDKNSLIVQSKQYEGANCISKSEFKYDVTGNMTEEIHYNGCSENPDYIVKYEYSYY
ncbi:MAG: hypothetical protein ACHQHP_01945 [Bacteroidia bacterium]